MTQQRHCVLTALACILAGACLPVAIAIERQQSRRLTRNELMDGTNMELENAQTPSGQEIVTSGQQPLNPSPTPAPTPSNIITAGATSTNTANGASVSTQIVNGITCPPVSGCDGRCPGDIQGVCITTNQQQGNQQQGGGGTVTTNTGANGQAAGVLMTCSVPLITAGVQGWSGANCASGASNVAVGTVCQITAASGFTCTSPGVCGSNGMFAATGACQASTSNGYSQQPVVAANGQALATCGDASGVGNTLQAVSVTCPTGYVLKDFGTFCVGNPNPCVCQTNPCNMAPNAPDMAACCTQAPQISNAAAAAQSPLNSQTAPLTGNAAPGAQAPLTGNAGAAANGTGTGTGTGTAKSTGAQINFAAAAPQPDPTPIGHIIGVLAVALFLIFLPAGYVTMQGKNKPSGGGSREDNDAMDTPLRENADAEVK